MCGPTHNQGQTLDLVFTLGLILSSLNLLDFTVSDHKCIVLTECPVSKTVVSCSWSAHIFNEKMWQSSARGLTVTADKLLNMLTSMIWPIISILPA